MGMNKTVEINGVTTAYMEEGQGVHVVLMHGWGQNKEMMINIFNHLKDRFHVVALDFPGFGESGLPTEAWGVIEYESFFEQFLDRIGIDRAIRSLFRMPCGDPFCGKESGSCDPHDSDRGCRNPSKA